MELFLEAEIRTLVNINVIHKNTDFLQVILEMEKLDIHFLPCVDDYQRFLGIVTRNKIFEAFESATNSNIFSTVHFDLSVANLERVIIKVQTTNIDLVLKKIADQGFRVTSHRFVPAVVSRK